MYIVSFGYMLLQLILLFIIIVCNKYWYQLTIVKN